MAVKTWIGNSAGNEGDMNTAANWSPSGVPEADDSIIFDGNAANAVTTNLTTLSSVAVASVDVVQGFAYALGSGGQFPAINTKSGGRMRIDCTTSGFSGGIVQSAGAARQCDVVNAPTGGITLCGGLDLSSTGISRGNVTIARDPNFGSSSIATTVAANARIGSPATVTVSGNVTLNGGTFDGTVSTSVNLGTVEVGGSLTVTGSATATSLTVDGGNVTWNSTGTVTALIGRTGRFTSSSSYTITNATVDGTFTLSPGSRATVTNPIDITSAGAPLTLPAGATIDVTLPVAS